MRREYLVGVGFIGVAVVTFLGVLFYNPDPQQSTLPLTNDGAKSLSDARTAGDIPERKLTSLNPTERSGDGGAGTHAPVTEPKVEPSNLPGTVPTVAAVPTGTEQPIGEVLRHNPDPGSPAGPAIGTESQPPPAPLGNSAPGGAIESPKPGPANPEPAKPEVRTGGEELRPNRGGTGAPPPIKPERDPGRGIDPTPRTDPPPAPTKPIMHKIEKNDTLVALAEKYYGDRDEWRRIQKANKGLNANKLYVGKTIVIPPKDAGADTARSDAPSRGAQPTDTGGIPARPEPRGTYTVGTNDTLVKIARSQLGDGERWREIYQMNRDQLSNPNHVVKGMVLKMPAKSTSTADAGRPRP